MNHTIWTSSLVAVSAICASSHAQIEWSKPTFGLEFVRPSSDDRDFTITSITARSYVRNAFPKLPILRIGSEFSLMHASGARAGFENQSTLGFSSGVFTRLSPLPLSKTRPFIEAGLALSYFFEPFPMGGSKTNGVVKWGYGLEHVLDAHTILSVQYRGMHISNGGGLVPSNPSYDGSGFAIQVRRRG